MVKVDYLIVGQGIAGTLLSYELMCAGKRVLVIDDDNPNRSSLVAGAVLNPMAGKHWSPTATTDRFIMAAVETYRKLEVLLQKKILKKTNMYVFHESAQNRELFVQQQKLFPEYLSNITNEQDLEATFNAPNGIGNVEKIWQVEATVLLEYWKRYLLKSNALYPEKFEHDYLIIQDQKVNYKDIEAGKIIFCEGAHAAENPMFSSLPFTRNKGEALLLYIPDLSLKHIYHRKLRLIPRNDGLFWYGSNYQWHFTDLIPDIKWENEAIAELASWLRLSFTISAHIVAQRPTTAGQIPLIGIHPEHKSVAIFNGLGTRGFSSGPFWAKHFVTLLTGKMEEMPDYDNNRFDKFF